MTDQKTSMWNILRLIGPAVMFFGVLFVCIYFLAVPLVLAVVLACLLAIVEWVTLTWIMRRAGNLG